LVAGTEVASRFGQPARARIRQPPTVDALEQDAQRDDLLGGAERAMHPTVDIQLAQLARVA
jgi:hypothetical protein